MPQQLGLVVPNFEETRDFYLAALKPLGYRVIPSKELEKGRILGLGRGFFRADFWIGDANVGSENIQTDDEKTTKCSQLIHIEFAASNRTQVREFYEAAIAAGGKCNDPPGLKDGFPTYYAAFVVDLDGRSVAAVCLMPEFLAEP